MQLILASQSPQRKSLLGQLGISFTIQPADVDESPLKNETPLAYVKRIAIAKAAAVSTANPGSVVLAADTPVIVGRRILQKPATLEEAKAMLRLQSGRRVHIPTVVAVADASGKIHHKVVESWIKLKRLSEAEITAYLAVVPWAHLSAAARIENLEPFILTTHGSISGIIGLPLYETTVLLARAGIKINPFGGLE
ncbi:MAG: septum formation protein Maf [Alphaproteobacteria bacterium]|nr:MAG: septum formation protein Maf [Alphaproteobacteria bacterium]